MLPAKIKNTINTIIGYARWKGIIDSSCSDIPVFVYADTTWNSENHVEETGLCSAGGTKAGFHLDKDM